MESLTGTANFRVPAGLYEKTFELHEVKDVAIQHLSRQLKDDLLWARANGYQVILHVRDGTSNLTKPLKALVESGAIVLRKIGCK